MRKKIKLPRISEGEETGVVSDVYVSAGDRVEEEQSIIAVESDKATVDVPVDVAGKVEEVQVKKGDEISVGDTLIVLETNGPEPEEGDGAEQARPEEREAEQPHAEKEEEGASKAPGEGGDGKEEQRKKKEGEHTEQKAETIDRKESKAPEGEEESEQAEEENQERELSSEDVGAAPLARKFARELGIDLSAIKGGDPDMRVTREDVFEYARNLIQDRRSGQRKAESEGYELPDFSRWGDTERSPMEQIRRATANNTARSWKHIPHVTQFDRADITALEEFRKEKNATTEPKLTATSFLLKICAEALTHFPKFNASLDIQKKEVVFKRYISISVAVDTDNGLLMPVIRDVDKKTIPEIAGALLDLSEKARAGRLTAEEMDGGNFAVSNQGGIGGQAFTPIIFPPQVAIMGVSRATVEPVFTDEGFTPRTMLPLCVSYDHRLIDGADAARFLRWICETMEQPMNLLMV